MSNDLFSNNVHLCNTLTSNLNNKIDANGLIKVI